MSAETSLSCSREVRREIKKRQIETDTVTYDEYLRQLLELDENND